MATEYQVIKTSNRKVLEDKLAEAAAAGFEPVLMSPIDGDAVMVILRREPRKPARVVRS